MLILLLFYSPFNLKFKSLFIFGYPALYEYTVMARNYGISMLLMFILAIVFSSSKYKYRFTGPVLFLLANTNIHSALISLIFSITWPLYELYNNQWKINKTFKKAFLASTLGIFGFLVCILTIYPPRYDDLATHSHEITLKIFQNLTIKHEIFYIFGDNHFIKLIGYILCLIPIILSIFIGWGDLFLFFISIMTFCAFIAFFNLIYTGSYRHEALWIIFMVTILWIRKKTVRNFPSILINKIGVYSLYIVLSFQVIISFFYVFHEKYIPNSRAKDFSNFLHVHSQLQNAIILSSEDELLETFPYYINNNLYIMTQRKIDKVVPYSSHSYKNYSLSNLLETANNLAQCTRKEIIILIANDDDNTNIMTQKPQETQRISGYKFKFNFSDKEIKFFKKNTTKLISYPNGSLEKGFIAYSLSPRNIDSNNNQQLKCSNRKK